MDCKHEWHFNADLSEGLTCARCGAKTAPRTPEQRAQDMMQDIATIGSAWSRGGERIDPTTVYKFYEPPKPVGAWVIDPSPDESHGPSTMFHVFRKPTDEQIKNTEQAFGWKWKDLADRIEVMGVPVGVGGYATTTTTPPAAQRQPLTEDQIDDIWNRYCDEMGEASINDAYDIARAIEAAHGITGEKT